MSASMNWMPWNAAIGWSNWLALLARRPTAASSAAWAMPTACAPMVGRVTARGSHRDPEALAFLAEAVLHRHLAVAEVQRHRGRAVDAELALLLAHREALRARLDQERGDALGAACRGPTVANTVMTPACEPLVTHILEPFST